MNYKMIARVQGFVLLALAGLLMLPLIAALCYGENVLSFLITIFISLALGGLLLLIKPKSTDLYAKDGFVCVALAWISMSLIGALPYVISGDIPNYIDAFFETVSGLTTTGATILENVEGLSRGVMFWRLFTHWIGGMGVLVFIMAVMPLSGEHSMHIMRAEMPGPVVGKLVPRARDTAKILYIVYIALTVLETVFLLFGGMSFYEALLHAFATAGTGGFSTRADSIAAFNSTYIEGVIAVFMFIFGINFNLYYLLLIGRVKDALSNEELHWYLGIIVVAVLSIAVGIEQSTGGLGRALHVSFFNVMTILSTAGFGICDFTQWPVYTQWIIVILMFIGGCAGSTGGGLKLSRVMVLVKSAFVDIRQVIYPRSVNHVRMDGKRMEDAAVKAISTYFAIYILVLMATTLAISFDGFDTATNFTASISCLSNVGPGLGLVGPAGNYNIFSYGSKLIMSLAMLIGRLEFYPILILFSPTTWKKR